MIGMRQRAYVILATLPAHYGGDFLSGSYLFYHNDIKFCLSYFLKANIRVDYLSKTEYAHDFHSEAQNQSDGIYYNVSYKNRQNYLNDNLMLHKLNTKQESFPYDMNIESENPDALSIQTKITRNSAQPLPDHVYLVGYSDENFYKIEEQ